MERADAADGEGLQHGESAAAGLVRGLVLGLILGLILVLGFRGPLPPLVVLPEQVERLPGCQDGQGFPGVPWKTETFSVSPVQVLEADRRLARVPALEHSRLMAVCSYIGCCCTAT